MAKHNLITSSRLAANLSLRQRLAFNHPRMYFTAPALAWAIFVLVASLAPPDDLPQFDFNMADKVEHGLSYALLGALGLRAWLGVRRPAGLSAVLGTVGVAGCWGMVLEVFQAMTDYRTFDWMDGLCNLAGAFVGAFAWFFIVRVMQNRSGVSVLPLPSLEPAADGVTIGRVENNTTGNRKE